MINKKNRLKIFTMVLIFGITSVVYAQNENGIFTLTNIPLRYNGKYAILEGFVGYFLLFGGEYIDFATDSFVASRILDGQVILPIWFISNDHRVIESYSGNDGNVDIYIFIHDSAIITVDNWDENYKLRFTRNNSVNFSNGSARRSWNDAD